MTRWIDSRRSLATIVAAVGAALLLATTLDLDPASGEARASARTVLLTVGSASRAIPVPVSYLGLSTEYRSLAVFERRAAVFERLLAQVHASGDGPLVVRIGGDSADHTFWEPPGARPAWVFGLTRGWLHRLRTLVRRTGLRLIVDLNLVTGSPALAARWARAAEHGLPAGSIAGFEVGNEPDIYSRRDWLSRTAADRSVAERLPARFTAPRYDSTFDAYRRALRRAVPGTPLLGPALANPRRSARWVESLLRAPHPGLAAISAHVYPFTACSRPGWPSYPTIPRVLGPRGTTGLGRIVARAVRDARQAGLPVRIDELNSVTCGGRPGVSDTFATALWAPSALFTLLRAGAAGVNVHIRAGADNAAIAAAGNGLEARPLLYGLILFARTLGPGAELLPDGVSGRSAGELSAWPVRLASGELRVLLVNRGPRRLTVRVRVPPSGWATVWRMLARSAGARSGVSLAGRWLARDGRWHGDYAAQTVPAGRDGYAVDVPRMSGALVSVPPARTGR